MSYHPIECNFKQILRQRSSSATMRNMIQWNMVKLLRSWFSTCFNIVQYYCFKIIIIINIITTIIIIIKKVVGWLYAHTIYIHMYDISHHHYPHLEYTSSNWSWESDDHAAHRRWSFDTLVIGQGISKFVDDIINPLVNVYITMEKSLFLNHKSAINGPFFIIYWLVVWNIIFMTFHSVGNVIIPTDEPPHFSEG